jgi:acetyl esterase
MSEPVQLEPEARDFVEFVGNLPLVFDVSLEEARQGFEDVQSSPVEKPITDTEDLLIPSSLLQPISVRLVRPQNGPAILPAIVYIHGGGWVLGSACTHDRLVRALAVGAHAAVVFVNYSLSPEAKYPTAAEECYAVATWVADHGHEHGLDAKRLVVAGDSAGGNLAAAVTLLTKARGGPRIRQQVLFCPATNASFDTESYGQFATGHALRRDEMIWYWNQYVRSESDRNEITASPLRATIDQLRGLPPALVITAEADVLRDEGEAYANQLRAAGVRVTAARFQGTSHDFMMLNIMANTAASRGAMNLTVEWLRSGINGDG